MTDIDNYTGCGHLSGGRHLPTLLEDLETVVDGENQTDPKFKSTRLYVKLGVRIRYQLIEQRDYLKGNYLAMKHSVKNSIN